MPLVIQQQSMRLNLAIQRPPLARVSMVQTSQHLLAELQLSLPQVTLRVMLHPVVVVVTPAAQAVQTPAAAVYLV
jgi:hypothetical protein